jgi:hypothetical protein
MTNLLEDIALIDMDGTIANYDMGIINGIEPFLNNEDKEWLKDIHNPNKPKHIKSLSKYIRTRNGFWEELPVIPDGLEIMKQIYKAGFNIHILTKGPFSSLNAWNEKITWCKNNLDTYFGSIGIDYGISITSDKGLVYGKILFDDYVPYCQRWLTWRPRGLVIQLENEHNKEWIHPNVVKFNGKNIDEVCEKIILAKKREGIYGK